MGIGSKVRAGQTLSKTWVDERSDRRARDWRIVEVHRKLRSALLNGDGECVVEGYGRVEGDQIIEAYESYSAHLAERKLGTGRIYRPRVRGKKKAA